MWKPDSPQGNEAAKIKYLIPWYTRGRGLDLGCGPWKAYKHFIGIDNESEWAYQHANDLCGDCTKLDLFADGSMDFVFSAHTLEHFENYKEVLREWWRVIRAGGHMVLYLPHKDFYPNIGTPEASPFHKHDFLPIDIINAMRENPGWDLLENQERNGEHEYSFLQVYRKRKDTRCLERKWDPDVRRACVCRFGAIGDQLVASSILPALKEQGYHITYVTTTGRDEIIKHDPHIDRILIQDMDQVPNEELGAFWASNAAEYDKFINLSESMEATWLAVPFRSNHQWPHAVRHKYMNANYLEFTHELAQVPFKPAVKFYSTAEEREWALGQRGGPDKFVVAIALGGSSVHKASPATEVVTRYLLDNCPKAEIHLLGDKACKILEDGWENEPRVHCHSGEWSIRESLSFVTTAADLVIGPETGLLNAVSFEDVPKILLLSHSSVENIGKHWTKTYQIEPKGVPCYPCHMLHYSREYCHEHAETGAALCAASYDEEEVCKTAIAIADQWMLGKIQGG